MVAPALKPNRTELTDSYIMYVIYTFIYVFDFFEDASTTVLLFNLKQDKVYVCIYIKNHFIYIIIMYILKQIEKFRAWQRTTPFPY